MPPSPSICRFHLQAKQMKYMNDHRSTLKTEQQEIASNLSGAPPNLQEGSHPILIQGGVAVAVILAITFLTKTQWEGIINLVKTLKNQ